MELIHCESSATHSGLSGPACFVRLAGVVTTMPSDRTLGIFAYVVQHMRNVVYALYRLNDINICHLDGSSPPLQTQGKHCVKVYMPSECVECLLLYHFETFLNTTETLGLHIISAWMWPPESFCPFSARPDVEKLRRSG